jgi:Flp pilus assembly protein TadB
LRVVHAAPADGAVNIRVDHAARGRGRAMPLVTFLIIVAIFFLILYLIWLLPAPWRVRQIIQIIAVIMGLLYLLQHPSLLHF